jgi:hypothetical protein
MRGHHFFDLYERRRMHRMRGGVSPAFFYLCSPPTGLSPSSMLAVWVKLSSGWVRVKLLAA